MFELSWVPGLFMEVIRLEIGEIVGFCQFNPPVVSSNQLSTLHIITTQHNTSSLLLV